MTDPLPCSHQWMVYSTALCPPTILVTCSACRTFGQVRDYTRAEWAAAFFAPGNPYQWHNGERVHQGATSPMTPFPSTPDLLSRIADFERLRAYEPSRVDRPDASTAYVRLHWALANLPAPDGGGTPLVCVNGITYAAGSDGGVVRGKVTLNYGQF